MFRSLYPGAHRGDTYNARPIWSAAMLAQVLNKSKGLPVDDSGVGVGFAQEQVERFGLQEKKALTAKCRELDKAKIRVVEIDQLIQKSYRL